MLRYPDEFEHFYNEEIDDLYEDLYEETWEDREDVLDEHQEWENYYHNITQEISDD